MPDRVIASTKSVRAALEERKRYLARVGRDMTDDELRAACADLDRKFEDVAPAASAAASRGFSAVEHAELRKQFALALSPEFVRRYLDANFYETHDEMLGHLFSEADAMAKRFGVDE